MNFYEIAISAVDASTTCYVHAQFYSILPQFFDDKVYLSMLKDKTVVIF
jgi:hypothetical protein